MIQLARDGANIGSFSQEEVKEGLRTGKFLPTDLAWENGMPSWRPLSEVMPQPTESAPPLPISLAIPPAPSGAGVASTGEGLPWENRTQLGLAKAFIDTVAMILTQPSMAFTVMKKEGDMIGPMWFALIGGSIGLIVSHLFTVGIQALMPTIGTTLGVAAAGLWTFVLVLFAPVIVLATIFVWAAVLHVCLMLVGGAKQPFETTFRVASFSLGATYLLALAPVCGGVIALIWSTVTECIGLARAHETDTGRAVVAVLLPFLVCCGGIFLLAFVLGGFGVLNEFFRH